MPIAASPCARLAVAAILAAGFTASRSGAAWPQDRAEVDPPPVAKLISALVTRAGDKPFLLGLAFAIPKGWETYWRTVEPGGMSPKLVLQPGANVRRISPLWPTPRLLPGPGGKPPDSLGYDAPFILPLRVEAGPGPTRVALSITYGLCSKDLCLPYTQALSIVIPAGTTTPSPQADEIRRAEADEPGRLIVRTAAGADDVTLRPDTGGALAKPVVAVERPGHLDILRHPPRVPGGRALRLPVAMLGGAVAVLLIDGGRGWEASPPWHAGSVRTRRHQHGKAR